jgi:hypothetical protein
LRLRFEDRELALLRGAERLYGIGLTREPRPEHLRLALNLARAGQKLGHATAGTSISFEEGELGLLVSALRYAHDEIGWASHSAGDADQARRGAVLVAYPELADQGWRSFALNREIEALATRLQGALLT